jgi:chromosome segregation ATPase
MSIDYLISASKIGQDDPDKVKIARLLRELLSESSAGAMAGTKRLLLREAVRSRASDRALDALDVEFALRVLISSTRRIEDRLDNELAAQAASHEVQLSECRAQFAKSQADLARFQAENAALRRENDAIANDLTEAQLQLGEDEYEIGELRRRLELPQRPSPTDFN